LEKVPLLKYASEAWAFHARAALDVEEVERRVAQFPLHSWASYDLPFALLEDTDKPNAMTKVL
jgi:hypothetical protein